MSTSAPMSFKEKPESMMRFNPFPRKWLLTAILLLFAASACTTTEVSRMADLPLSDKPLVGKFVWHDLITDDVKQARQFYGVVMGWSYEATTHPNGGDYTLITLDGQFVGGMVELADPPDADYSRWLPYVSVADVDQAAAFTQESGGDTVAGPQDLASIGRVAAIHDPQGAVIGLLRSDVGDPDDSVEPMPGMVIWNELLASDVASALAFYQGLAGYRVKVEERPLGQYYDLRAGGYDRAGVMQRPVDDVEPIWLTHFGVADVVSATGRATQAGGTVLLAPTPKVRDGRMALIRDPAGAIFALSQLK
jgi:predicted enzyme related to lactoylglutathione lyase